MKTNAKGVTTHDKCNHMKYSANLRNVVYGIRRGKSFKGIDGKHTYEYPAEVLPRR